MDYQQALDYLYSQLPMFHRIGAPAYKANLDNTLALAEVTGFPYSNFKSIHVAGTNGKGSVSHMLASIFRESGCRTGLFTSPHLIDFRERIKVNGEMIPIDYVTSFIEKHQNDFERIKPSFFEMTFILGMCWFRDTKVDIAIIETGLGGRLDSTNVINPLLSVITNIGYDHMQFLGNSLEEIAAEKAGIIKPGIPVVIGESSNATDNVFIKKAKDSNCCVLFADKVLKINTLDIHYSNIDDHSLYSVDLTRLPLSAETDINHNEVIIDCPLTGNYQQNNIRTVIGCLPFLKGINSGDLTKGIKNTIINTGLMGRWQVLGKNPLIICDIGHNTHGMKWVVNQIHNEKYRFLHFVLGVVNDKDISGMLALLPKDAEYYFCKADIPRGLNSEELTGLGKEAGLNGKDYGSVANAFKNALRNAGEEDMIFIGGSAFTVAEVLALLDKN